MKEPSGLVEWVTAWHGLEATKEEAGDPPACHTDKEWRMYWPAFGASVGKKKLTYDKVFMGACEDCMPEYQNEQLALGRCNPLRLSITPLFREPDDGTTE